MSPRGEMSLGPRVRQRFYVLYRTDVDSYSFKDKNDLWAEIKMTFYIYTQKNRYKKILCTAWDAVMAEVKAETRKTSEILVSSESEWMENDERVKRRPAGSSGGLDSRSRCSDKNQQHTKKKKIQKCVDWLKRTKCLIGLGQLTTDLNVSRNVSLEPHASWATNGSYYFFSLLGIILTFSL